jgi:hypothetical protein
MIPTLLPSGPRLTQLLPAVDVAVVLRHLLRYVSRGGEDFYEAIYVEPSGTVISMRDNVPFANQMGGLWTPP